MEGLSGRMKTRALMLSVTAICFLSVACAGGPAMFDRAECGVRFEMPARLFLSVDSAAKGKLCKIAMEPEDIEKLIDEDEGINRHGTSVEVFDDPLEVVLDREGTFANRTDGWVILGRQGIESEAVEISGPGWKGLRGTAESGCHFEEGGFAGLCPVEVALISNGSRTALIVANERSLGDFAKILATFQFR